MAPITKNPMDNVKKAQENLVWGVECRECHTPIIPIEAWGRPFVCPWCSTQLPPATSFGYVVVQCRLCQSSSMFRRNLAEDFICPCRKDFLRPSGSFLFLERYELLEILGKGAVGEVWKARDTKSPSLDIVAIKFMKGITGELMVRAKREAGLLIHLDHPGIVPVYGYFRGVGFPIVEERRLVGFGNDGNSMSMVMKYVAGGNFEDWLKKRQLNPRAVAKIFIQIYDALMIIHGSGVIHRDLKPTNILMDGDRPVIADFGLSRPMDATSITAIGTIMGTLDYMSPEQAKGKKADTRSDLYATGAMMWKILFHKPVFIGSSPLVQLRKIAKDPIPADLERLPPDFRSILEKLLRKNPQMRYQSAEEIQKALREFLENPVTVAEDIATEMRKTQKRIPRAPTKTITRPRMRKLSRQNRFYPLLKWAVGIAVILSVILVLWMAK